MEPIIIIGGGKLGFAIAQGLINAKVDPQNILVVCRSVSSMDKFYDLGARPLRDGAYSHLKNTLKKGDKATIFLAVRPQDAGGSIEVLLDILDKNTSNYQIVSTISGLNINMLSDYSHIHPKHLVTATMNTNVAQNCGIIVYTKFDVNQTRSEDILSLLGEVQYVSQSKDVLSSVTTIGSMNAVDALVLDKIYNKFYSDVSFKDFLIHVEGQLVNNQIEALDGPIQNYLKVKSNALKTFSPIYVDTSEEISRSTLLSTVNFLSKSGKTAIEHIQSVVTPGGCTECGIDKLRSLSLEKFFKIGSILDFLNIVHKRAKHFSKDILGSISQVKLEKLRKTKEVQNEAIKRIYGRGSFVKFPC